MKEILFKTLKFQYNKWQLTLWVLLLFTVSFVNAQQTDKTLPVNLETVLKLAGADNLVIQQYQQRYELALADRAKAREWYLPTIYGGATTHYLTGAPMNTDGRFFKDVERNNLWAGLGLFAEWDISKGLYGSLAAKQKARAAMHRSTAERNQAILQAVHTYYDLQAEQMKYAAFNKLVSQADTIVRQIRIQVEVGILFKTELLLAKSNYNHLKIAALQSKIDFEKKSALLVNLLNIEEDVVLVSADTAIIPVKMVEDIPDSSSSQDIYTKRPEYRSLKLGLRSIQTERKMTTTGLLMPKVRLGAYGSSFGSLDSGFVPTNELNLSLLWQIPTGRLLYRGDLRQFNARVMLQENSIEQLKNQVRQEVTEAKSQLRSATKQVEIAGESLQLSAEALSQSIQRQKLGTVIPFEVFQAQEFYMKAQIDYLQAISSHNKAQYSLYVAMGNNL